MTRAHPRPARALAFTTAAAMAGFLALGPVAARAAENNNRLILSVQLSNRAHGPNFEGDLQYNCNLFFSGGRVPEGSPPFATTDGPATGGLSPAQGSGEVFTRHASWQAEALPPSHARPVTFTDLGISLQGSTVFVTGRITHGRPLISAVRRQRLAVVRHAKIENTMLVDQRKRPVPDSYTFIASGRLRMLPAMSRALETTRCKNRRKNRLSRRLKPGYLLGSLTAGYRPDRATGLEGAARMSLTVSTGTYNDSVTIEPAPGVTSDGQGGLTSPLTGLPAPLVCIAGVSCEPRAGVGVGGFDLVFGSRRASIGNVRFAKGPPGTLGDVLTGTLDGAPLTIADGGGSGRAMTFTGDFDQRAGAALGQDITGEVRVEAHFTRTGPAG